MPALYTITTRASGTILTAAIYNADHQNHVNFGDAQHLGSFSQNQGQMQTQATPGDVGSESLAVSISDELARIRYMISQIRGTTYWYSASATQGAYPIGAVPAGFRNVLYNPNMYLAQRIGMTNGNSLAIAASTTAYQADRWYVGTGANQAGVVNWYVSGTVGNVGQINITARSAGQTGTGAQYIAQPLDSDQIVPLQGKYVTATVRLGTGAGWAASAIAVQLFVGTGTPAKRGAGFTGETQVINQNLNTTASMATTTFSATSGSPVPINATQGEVRLLWNPVGTAIAGEALYLLNVQLEAGTQFSGFEYRPAAVELGICQRFYSKSFTLLTQPAQNSGALAGVMNFAQIGGASIAQWAPSVFSFPVSMRAGPAIVLYNPSAANGQVRDASTATDWSGSAVSYVGLNSFALSGTPPAGSAAAHSSQFHWTADAEI